MNTALTFTPFKKEDFPEYLSWFQDPELQERLGPMEEEDEWLTYALNQQQGLTEFAGGTYSVFEHEKLVAVVGVEYPDQKIPTYGISSIAVNPMLRGSGLGKRILQGIMKLHPLKNGQHWIAYVDEKNQQAKSFFEHNGWKCAREIPDHHGMYLLEYRKESAN